MAQFGFGGAIVDDDGFTVRESDPRYQALYARLRQQPQGQSQGQGGTLPTPLGGLPGAGGTPGSVLVGGAAGGGSPGSVGYLQSAAAAADPWAPQRGQYQTALQDLMRGGASAVAADPSVQARMKAGTDAVGRSMAAQGYLGSGNILEELQSKGQDIASQEYDNQFNRLSQLAGVNAGSPGASAGILAQIPGQLLSEQQTAFTQGKESAMLPHQIDALKQGNVKGAFEQTLLEQQKREMELAQMRARAAKQNYPQGFLV